MSGTGILYFYVIKYVTQALFFCLESMCQLAKATKKIFAKLKFFSPNLYRLKTSRFRCYSAHIYFFLLLQVPVKYFSVTKEQELCINVDRLSLAY
jgi:hypothetical protein